MNHHRIGVIGLGQRIAHVLAAMKEVGWMLEVAGYADPSPVGLEILADAGIDPGMVYPDEAALLADGPFDLVMIGSPNHLHFDHLKAAFAAGYPIFAEKPIVRTPQETFALARILSRASTPPLFIGLVMRSMPIVREVIARCGFRRAGRARLHGRHRAPAARARRLSRPQLAAQGGVGRLLHARQGLPRLRYLRPHRRRPGGEGGQLRRAADLPSRPHRSAPNL